MKKKSKKETMQMHDNQLFNSFLTFRYLKKKV